MTEDQFNEKIEDSAKQAVQLEEAVKTDRQERETGTV